MTIFISILIISCNSSHDSVTESNSNNSSTDTNSILAFSGLWLNKKYYEELMKNKSPRISQTLIDESCIYMPTTINGKAMYILSFHEGSGELSITKKSDNYYVDGWEYDSPRPKLIEYHSKDNSLKIGNTQFIKLRQKVPINENPKILEEILFGGNYKLNDKTINFSFDNKVTGLDGFSYYDPFIDYADAAMNIDQLVLSNDKSERSLYGFKFIKDSLFIYNLKCMQKDSTTGDCYVVDFGSVLYKLKKEN